MEVGGGGGGRLQLNLASFPGLRGGDGKAWNALCAHARNYCEIYVREQWACTQNVIINYCTRVFEIRKVYTVVHRSSGDRKEERH